jgi:hypothetical protein
MPDPHEMTWRQYRDAQREAVRAEYDCTHAEAADCRPDERMMTEWLREIVKAAEGGKPISRRILDDIANAGMWFQFRRDARDYNVPEGYMIPEIRKTPSAQDIRKGRYHG